MNETYNPYRRFILILAMLTALSTVVLSSIISYLIEKQALEETVDITRQGVEVHFKTLIPDLFQSGDGHHHVLDADTYQNTKNIIKMHFDIYGIEKSKFIQSNGQIYFSYHQEEIGQALLKDKPFSKALANNVAVEKADFTYLRIWIPILNKSGKVEQVILVDKNIDKEIQSIRHIQGIVSVSIALTFLLLFFSLRHVFIRSTNKIKLAYHDPLTELPNRRLFINHLDLVLEKNSTSAVVFIDLDGFKTINDTLGHDVGDEVLKAVGRRLTEHIRKDDMVARIGGDEFTMLLFPIHDAEDAMKAAQKILDAFARPFVINGHDLYVTPSIGIAICPYHGQDADTLLKRADTAMYHAKNQGKNRYQIYVEDIDKVIHVHKKVK